MSNKLLPKNSIISESPLSGNTYHVIKFYMVLTASGKFEFESDEKHLFGKCKYCSKFKVKEAKE
jgi:hypothetical protein